MYQNCFTEGKKEKNSRGDANLIKEFLTPKHRASDIIQTCAANCHSVSTRCEISIKEEVTSRSDGRKHFCKILSPSDKRTHLDLDQIEPIKHQIIKLFVCPRGWGVI